jgi:hypothetical protein
MVRPTVAITNETSFQGTNKSFLYPILEMEKDSGLRIKIPNAIRHAVIQNSMYQKKNGSIPFTFCPYLFQSIKYNKIFPQFRHC